MGNKNKESDQSMVDAYYKKITRIVEYYVIVCFIIITVFPLLEYSWIPGFIKFIYFTGFPLLLLLILISLVKDPLLNLIKRHVTSEHSASDRSTGKK